MSDQYLKPNPDALKKIKHIVVLMMENRSFDNMLGWLYDDEEPPHGQQFEGLHKGLWNALDNIDADGVPFKEQVYIRKNGEAPSYGSRAILKRSYPENFCLPEPDPGEGFKDTNHQLFEYYEVASLYPPIPTNGGFVNNYASAMLYGAYSFGDRPTDPRDIMACYTPEQTPVISTLAKQFAVCDHWHCSVPSQTLPNRDFVHAATSTGFVNNKPTGDCDAKTVYQLIQDKIDGGDNTLSWRIYSGESNGQPFSLTRTIMTQLQDKAYDTNFKPISEFYKAAEKGELPSYCFLEPQFSGSEQNDQHPPQDIRPGEQLMADIYNAVVNSPNWDETLFVITYDEHGGCYDHVAPPNNAMPPNGYGSDPGQDGFLFNRFGVRVPTVVISPYIKQGLIARPSGYTPFDHTSIIATVCGCFDLDGPLTERDKKAPDLSCLLTLGDPRKDKPAVTPLSCTAKKSDQENDLQQLAADCLDKTTGIKRKDDESAHDYIHRAYHKHFVKNDNTPPHKENKKVNSWTRKSIFLHYFLLVH